MAWRAVAEVGAALDGQDVLGVDKDAVLLAAAEVALAVVDAVVVSNFFEGSEGGGRWLTFGYTGRRKIYAFYYYFFSIWPYFCR